MLKEGKNDDKLQGFYTPPPKRYSKPPFTPKSWKSEQTKKKNTNSSPTFHVIHKVPNGNSPYVKAKHVQLIEKDPGRAVAMFWNAINSGDRVDSALKDMAVVMKQLDRSNEAIEAIKSFRHLCSLDSQDSLDNVLVELYKRSGRLEEQIEILKFKLKRLEEGIIFGRNRLRAARSQGKKIHITLEQEYARLLGNLGWAYLQQNDYKTAEEFYRKALSIETDRNMQCNLAVCLICMSRLTEAKFLLHVTRTSAPEGQMDESYAKSYDRASDLLAKMEGQPNKRPDESIQNINIRVLDNQLDLKDGTYSDDSFDMSNIGSAAAFNASFNCKGTYTSSVLSREIPKSPFTQPKRNFSQDNGNCKKGSYRNEPVSCSRRRLEFENPADSVLNPTRNWKNKYSVTEQKGNENMINKPLDQVTSPDVNRKENLPPIKTSTAGTEGTDLCDQWIISSFKSQKSWADMVEEDEQEMIHMHPFSQENVDLNIEKVESSEEKLSRNFQSLSVNEFGVDEVASKQPSAVPPLFINQQKREDHKRSNRLQVFRDLTTE